MAASWNRIRPKPTQFPYHDKSDDEIVKRIEHGKYFNQERSDSSVGLEYAVMEGIHNHGWFGSGASVTPTAKYDDMVNHVDAVVTFQSADQPMHLALDVTTGGDYRTIESKINENVDNLTQGKLTEVKYFIDDENGSKKPVQAPRVIIALTPQATSELVEKMAEKPESVSKDSIQLLILDEALEQLSFGLETLKNSQASQETREKYQELINYLSAIKQEKSPSVVPGTTEQAIRETISQILNQHRQFLA